MAGMPAAEKPLVLIGRRHAELGEAALRIARWSAGAVVATRALRGIGTGHAGHGLFTSLNADARSTLACLARVPLWLPLVLFGFALYLNNGAFYAAARQTLVGPANPYRVDLERGMVVNRLVRALPRGWRRWHVFGWWLLAAGAGAATVAVTGALLRTSWNPWLVWGLVLVAGWTFTGVESVLTERRYRRELSPTPPDRADGLRRAREWRELRPGDRSAMPWMYAYSGLSTEELEDEFRGIGMSGPTALTSKVLGLVIVVLVYSLLPAPDVSRFAGYGLTGCLFTTVHGFAGVAEENLGLSVVGAAVLLVLLPVSVLVSYLRFMVRYRFPPAAMAQVLVRETGFALRMPVYIVLPVGVLGAVIALLMWASAAVANAWNSPVAGTLVLTVPVAVIVWAVMRAKVRGPLPR